MVTAHTPSHASIPLNQNDTADQRLLMDRKSVLVKSACSRLDVSETCVIWCVEHDKCEMTKVDKITKGEQITKVDKMIKV